VNPPTPPELPPSAPLLPAPPPLPAEKAAAPGGSDDLAIRLVDAFQQKLNTIRKQVAQVIVGQDRVLDEILIALLAGGHVLVEGVPGLAKTLIVSSVSRALTLQFGRIQFTPDLMPADVTGTQVITENPTTRERQFSFRRGPVFVNLLLADEINRASPKTQAALLEAMQEGNVTVGGARHTLERPFMVLATQNPIEQEGTYRLPEAQLDRFLLKIIVDYPSHDDERGIIERTTGTLRGTVSPVIDREEILALQRIVRALRVSNHIVEYATRIVRASRPGEEGAASWVDDLVAWGAGPRATQALVLAAKARTLMSGRFAVTRAAVRDVARPVLRHRVLPNFRAEAEGLGADDIVGRLVDEAPFFEPREGFDDVTRAILGI